MNEKNLIFFKKPFDKSENIPYNTNRINTR